MSEAAYAEFPKMLVHEATAATVIVKSAEEQERRFAEGFAEPGRSDAHAFAEAHSGAPAAYKPQRYPMWIDGCLVNDERQEKAARAGKMRPVDPYPMTITIGNGQQIVVKDRADHERMLGPALDAAPAAPPKPEMPSAAEWQEFQRAKASGELPLKGEAA